MSRVRKLPEHVINQIKAGEVVERPASVVKELLENAIDAQATEVEIELIDGGRQLIRIVDNGTGMALEDALLALERHATSKLSTIADLDQLSTFGFRGEALPSIAAVSDFALRTRRAEDAAGIEIHVQDGKKGEPQACGIGVGTEILVRDLFVNVPARRKFLRATSTELGHVIEVVQAMALAYYRVGLRLSHNGRVVLNYAPANTLAERFESVMAGEANEYVPVSFEKGTFRLEGFIQKPDLARAVPRQFLTFVNGRFVKDRIVRNGVLSGCTGLVMKGLVPGCVLFVTVDPSLVDVNAHPNKTEIRFTDAPLVQDLVTIALQSDLRKSTQNQMLSTLPTAETIVRMPAEMRRDGWFEDKQLNAKPTAAPLSLNQGPVHGLPSREAPQESFRLPQHRATDSGFRATQSDVLPSLFSESHRSGSSSPTHSPAFGHERKTSEHPLAEAQYLGQYKNCYLLFEAKGDLLVVDQHAFHERVLFEELAMQIETEQGLARQSLLAPLVVPVPSAVVDILKEEEQRLNHLGFEIELMANRTVALHALPTQVDVQRAADLFDDIVARFVVIHGYTAADAHPLILRARKLSQEWLDAGVRPANLSRTELFHLHLATVACHTAVRSGDPMNAELVRRLLLRGTEVDFFAHCPHGRPVWRRWTESDVAQWFARI